MAIIENELFGRKVSVTVALPKKGSLVEPGDTLVTFQDFKIVFEVEQNLNKEPNTAFISIYNLNSSQREDLSEKGSKVILSAGYNDNFDVLFTGDLVRAVSRKDGPDFITEIECKDSQRTIAHSSTRKSFRGGIKVKRVINHLIESMELKSTANTKILLQEIKSEYTNGKVLSGKSSGMLDKILKDQGMEWSVQNGRLQILRFGGVNDPVPVITLSKDNGLVGSPEEGTPDRKKGPKKYTVSSLLQPIISPGKIIEVDSVLFKGSIIASKVTHSGDNFGSQWLSIIEGNLHIR